MKGKNKQGEELPNAVLSAFVVSITERNLLHLQQGITDSAKAMIHSLF